MVAGGHRGDYLVSSLSLPGQGRRHPGAHILHRYKSPGDKISCQVWGPKVERVHDREILLSRGHWPRSRGLRMAPSSSGLAAVLAPMGGTRAEPRIDRLVLGLASLTSPRYTGPTGRLWSHIFRPFPLTPSSTSLHSSRQLQNALFQAESCHYSCLSVYHNYLLSPPSCLGMTPLYPGSGPGGAAATVSRLREKEQTRQGRSSWIEKHISCVPLSAENNRCKSWMLVIFAPLSSGLPKL